MQVNPVFTESRNGAGNYSAVFEHEKRATCAGTGQYGRSDCSQMFLTAATAYPGSGDTVTEFVNMLVSGQADFISRKLGRVANQSQGGLLALVRRNNEHVV